MRHFRIVAKAGWLAFVAVCAGPLWAQVGEPQARPPAQAAPMTVQSLAEQVFQAGLGESRAAAISAEAGEFANRMGALYLGPGAGENWREEVGRIHDPARVSALLLAAIGAELTPVTAADTRLQGALGAKEVASRPDGQGMELAARIELARPGALDMLAVRMRAGDAGRAETLGRIDELMAARDMVAEAVAARMNRELSFARGFAEAGGFDFPTAPDDIAADLLLQMPELWQEEALRVRLTLFAAFAPLGESAIDLIAANRAAPENRALHALLARARDQVLDQLAAEAGRAAARRLKGTPL